MKKIAISNFKATRLAVMVRVRQTRQPMLGTKRRVPIAEVSRPADVASAAWLGSMAGSAKLVGDIEALAGPLDDGEALR
jgi:hypothetical protein